MKKTLAFVITAILIALLIVPVGTTFADKDRNTEYFPLSLTEEGEADNHTLRNGQMMSIHPEGPVNYLIRIFRLNGAKPDTEYHICYVFTSDPTAYYIGQDVLTDEKGNGNRHEKWLPGSTGTTPGATEELKIVFIEGGTKNVIDPNYIGMGLWWIDGGTRAFETEVFEVYWD